MILCLCPNPSIDKFIWLEDFKPGKVNRITREQSYPGGKGVHVALGLAELGEECALLCFWGGETGKQLKHYCENKGIPCYGPWLEEPNRTSLTFRSYGDWDGTELLESGPFIEYEKARLFRLEFTRLLQTASAVCMSGSWPRANPEMDYTEFIIAAKKKGIKTFVDCSGKNLVKMLSSNPYCIHINNQEGFEVFDERSPLKIGEALLRSCDLAAITCGADGLYLSDKSQSCIHASCKLEKIISAVGSGDSLMAGLVTAYLRDLNLVDSAILSAACGSANCLREDLGMFYKKDVDKLVTLVETIHIHHEQTI
ncbi:MAG: PfkB family carbohydrate kinase [Ferruginibacter sp.]